MRASTATTGARSAPNRLEPARAAPECAQLAQEVVCVRLDPLLDEAASVGVAEDVDQLQLHLFGRWGSTVPTGVCSNSLSKRPAITVRGSEI